MNLILIYIILLIFISLIFSAVLTGFIRGLLRLRNNRVVVPTDWPSISVIVPARNEAAVLQRTLDSIFQQDYPGQWEIVVVDDRSTDETPHILSRLASENTRLRVITITDPRPASPKKNALARGIKASQGTIIVTTDADCVYDPHWLRSMITYMTPEVGVVAGLTEFDLPILPIPVWQKIQWLDFIVQQYMAAGAIGYGVPSSCN
ncbi:MAG: glycosyltransferase, partial [Calditrichota bacterium]